MLRPRLLLKTMPEMTRVYLTDGGHEVLRAVLPPPGGGHPRAAPVLLEGLALRLHRPLSVVLYATDWERSSALGLSDGFGFGNQTVHYEVEVVDPAQRRRGLGSFGDLRRLAARGGR